MIKTIQTALSKEKYILVGVNVPERGYPRIDRVFEWQMYKRKGLWDKRHTIVTSRDKRGYPQKTDYFFIGKHYDLWVAKWCGSLKKFQEEL